MFIFYSQNKHILTIFQSLPKPGMILPFQTLAEPLLLLVGGEAAVGVEVGGDAEPELRPHHQLVLLVIEQHPPLLLLQPHPLEQPQLQKKDDIFKDDEII
jgi:hypothetical protein